MEKVKQDIRDRLRLSAVPDILDQGFISVGNIAKVVARTKSM
jgi:hypothetical protein